MLEPLHAAESVWRAAALFACLRFLFANDFGTGRKRRRERQLSNLDAEVEQAAQLLFQIGMASDGSSASSEDDHDQHSHDLGGQRSINSKPRGTDSQLHRWITDEFWFSDPEFRSNLRVSHSTFLRIVQMVSATVTDSVNLVTGTVKQTREFKVAVGLYHLGHGGTWRTTANVAGIGLTTAKAYVESFAGVVIRHGKPVYMPGKPSPDRLLRVKRRFEERSNLGDVAMTIDGTHVPWTPDRARHREDYHNYKGWHSIACLMFVDSFYMFVDS
jgi:hypothetical protein